MGLPSLKPALRRWPLPLLLISLALTGVAAVDAHRAVTSQRETVARAVSEFASFATWSYGQHLQLRLEVMLQESLGAVNHGGNLHTSPQVPEARNLAHYLPYDSRCGCHRTRFGPYPTALFAFKLGARDLDVAVNTHPDPREGWEVDRPAAKVLPAGATPDYGPEDERWILDTISRRTRASAQPHQGYTLVFSQTTPRIIAYTLMPTTWGDTMVYGAEYARKGIVGVLEDVLGNPGLLPTTFTRQYRNRDVVVARVSDAADRALFESARSDEFPGAQLQMPENLGGMKVDVSVRPQHAGLLVIGGLPRSHLPFLLGVLALAAALSVVAVVQLRREAQLARMRSDFVANVSHELRTPLAQIRLFTETLRFGRARTEEQRDWSLGHIERETTRLSHLVENVLRFSRLGRDDDSRPAPVDASAEVQRLVDEFRPLAASRNARIETRIAPTGRVPLRPGALDRLVLNLLDNAIKYGPAGQVVTVSVEERAGEIHVAVADQGPGVPASEREKIWLEFQRGSSAPSAAGSGIGLSVVRDVARRHGGRAWVESVNGVGSGARFVVALPLVPHREEA